MSTTVIGAGSASNRRVLGASLAGTAVEFYDFYIYGTAAALVFPQLFFPNSSPSAQLLQSYATFAVAFFARPVGAAFFGHFGDRIGRKSTLVASLLTMGLSTLLIAFLPTYAVAGWIAPALLCLLRFGQGFGLGGEWGGAALLAVENAPPGWRARFGMFPQFGAPVGFIASNGLFLLLGLWLTAEDFQAWGWRLPFLASAILVALGLWVRLKIGETPAFQKAMAEREASHVPMAEALKRHPGALLGGTFAVVACFAIFYLSTAFTLGYGTTTLGYGRAEFLGVQLGAIPFLAVGIAAAGYWSDATNPRWVLMAGCAGTVLIGFLMGPMMEAGSMAWIWAWLSMALFIMGFVYGPLGAFLPDLFPARVRYTGASLAFNVGGIIGGGLAPMAAQYLAGHGGLSLVGYYLVAAGVLSLAGLLPLKERREPE
ncbi:MAG: MHS family MFS transporter [Phenylobacterium sp.]|uniref:MFS transporter n=1 Tax=Phenylobacterium sp. TaxID=1871053 RepID=UPI001A5F3EBC|nr:MFS transporter [Phenylobacterium sp.]MBL8770562.1 MHS family MFS transporter [Phenylobacterium sp.]